MMHISDVAKLVGITSRAIRHYHRIGLLPEPERSASGYRVYGLREVSRLIQIRQLTALGLTLSQVADALDDADTDIVPLLTELDADLARQQTELDRRRALVGELIERDEDPTLAPELADAVRRLRASAPHRAPEELEVAFLRVADEVEPGRTTDLAASYVQLAADPERARLSGELDALFAELADVDAGDPRVEQAARSMYALLPDFLRDTQPAEPTVEQVRLGELVLADLSPAQHRVLALLMAYERKTGTVQDRQ